MKELFSVGGGVNRDGRPVFQLVLACIRVVKSWYRLCYHGIDPWVGEGANPPLWGITPASVLPPVYAVGVLKGQPGPFYNWNIITLLSILSYE